MIGEHPDCYGLPELNLFLGDTLGESWQRYPVLRRLAGKDGLLRTLAQLHEGKQTDDTVTRAEEWFAQHSDWPVAKVFDHIQELVGHKILVEKSPTTAFQREYMERMLNVFPNVNILHLIRHPRGTAESVVSLRASHEGLNRLLESVKTVDPEKRWRETHELIIRMTENLPLGQCMRLKGEALLSNLENYLSQICEWLGIRTDNDAINAMMHPEHSPYACPGPPAAPRGNDPNFLSNPVLDRARLAKLKEPTLEGELKWRPGEMFAPETRKLAKQLGYQ
jgi:Sulfotransferase family